MAKVLKVKPVIEGLTKIGYEHSDDAGIDLRASGRWVIDLDAGKKEDTNDICVINPLERILAKTGVIVELPEDCWGSIRDRSGLALKQGLHVLAGVLDQGYRGEIGIVLINLSKYLRTLRKDDKIAQLVVMPVYHVDIEYTDDLTTTDRGAKGFGGTTRYST